MTIFLINPSKYYIVGMQLAQPATICCAKGGRCLLKRSAMSFAVYSWIVPNYLLATPIRPQYYK